MITVILWQLEDGALCTYSDQLLLNTYLLVEGDIAPCISAHTNTSSLLFYAELYIIEPIIMV